MSSRTPVITGAGLICAAGVGLEGAVGQDRGHRVQARGLLESPFHVQGKIANRLLSPEALIALGLGLASAVSAQAAKKQPDKPAAGSTMMKPPPELFGNPMERLPPLSGVLEGGLIKWKCHGVQLFLVGQLK